MIAAEQVKSASVDSLWHFLAQMPATTSAQIFYGLILSGLVGMLLHYVVKWAQGDITGSLFAYLFTDNPRRSVLSLSVLVGELVGEVGAGLFTNEAGVVVGWAVVLLSGFKTGYLIDSIANKGNRPVWTVEQREKQQQSEAEIPKANAPKAVLPITGEKP